MMSFMLVVVLAIAAVSSAVLSVVIPKDTTPIKVGEKDIVRLSGKGIAGAKIEAKVEGPAKIERENFVQERVQGEQLIGLTIKEFEIKPTGKGKVKVKITVTPPQPNAKPTVTEYECEVE